MSKIKLTIDKKELEFYCGLGFLGDLLENQDISVDNIGLLIAKNSFKYVPLFMYESILHGYKRNNKEIDFSLYDFIDMIQRDGGFGHPIVNKYLLRYTNTLKSTLNPDLPIDEDVDKEGVDVKKK